MAVFHERLCSTQPAQMPGKYAQVRYFSSSILTYYTEILRIRMQINILAFEMGSFQIEQFYKRHNNNLGKKTMESFAIAQLHMRTVVFVSNIMYELGYVRTPSCINSGHVTCSVLVGL